MTAAGTRTSTIHRPAGRRAEIVRRYRDGQLVREVAAAMGCSQQIVDRELRAGMSDPERRRIANANKARANKDQAARLERFSVAGAERLKTAVQAARGPEVTDCTECGWRAEGLDAALAREGILQCPRCRSWSFETFRLNLGDVPQAGPRQPDRGGRRAEWRVMDGEFCAAVGCIEPPDESGLCERHRAKAEAGEPMPLGSPLPPDSPLRPPDDLAGDAPPNCWSSKGRPPWNTRPTQEENATMGTKRKPDWGTPRTCTICGREFKSEQALGCHRGKAHKIGRDGRPLGAPPEMDPTPPTPPRRTQLLETTRVGLEPSGDERPGAMLPVRPMASAVAAAAVKALGVECDRFEIDGQRSSSNAAGRGRPSASTTTG